MHSYFLAIPLPAAIRSRLTSFCYGLPQVRWVEEENFHLTIRYLGPLADSAVANIHDCLQNLFFQPFPLTLQGIDHFHSKGKRGSIWMGVAENPHLNLLRKNIDRHLRTLNLTITERFHPHIILGYYERLNQQRLGDYLAAHADYQSLPIEVTYYLLMRSLHTPKRTIYETIHHYAATRLATGEN
jgi:2'-5' RNA ligase